MNHYHIKIKNPLPGKNPSLGMVKAEDIDSVCKTLGVLTRVTPSGNIYTLNSPFGGKSVEITFEQIQSVVLHDEIDASQAVLSYFSSKSPTKAPAA